MAKIGRPPGAVNLDKPYKEALRRAVARAQADNKPHTLDKIAEQHLITAALGDMSAIKELADRLDGKSMQETSLNVTNGTAREASGAELDARIHRALSRIEELGSGAKQSHPRSKELADLRKLD